MKNQHAITTLCEALEVSSSGYYDWQEAQANPPPRWLEDQRLKEQVLQIHRDSRQTYGAPRVQAHLRSQGRRHGRNRIGRLMREQGLCGRQKKRYRMVTTDSHHDQPIAPNRLAELPQASHANQIWVADITYISTAQGWVYVAAILDLYSRRIVGWAVSQQINTALVMMALSMALTHRQPPQGLIFHTDRGVQYASAQYRQALESARLLASMSRKGNCYDNAAMEAFWSTLKLELIYRRTFEDIAQVRPALFDYIEVFYNRQRLHSALGYRTPAAFEMYQQLTQSMNRLNSPRPVKQRRALLESNPPRDNWIERRRNKNVSAFGEAQTSPNEKPETLISEPEYALQNSSKTVSKSSNIFRAGQHQQNALRNNYVSSYPFFRSKRRMPSATRSCAWPATPTAKSPTAGPPNWQHRLHPRPRWQRCPYCLRAIFY